MTSMPFEANSYNNYVASMAATKPMVQMPPPIPPALQSNKPTMMHYPQFPPSFISHHPPYTAPPINVAPWNGVGQWSMTTPAMPPIPPPFPPSFQPVRQPGQMTPNMSTPSQPPAMPLSNVATTKSMSPVAKPNLFIPSQSSNGQWPSLHNFVSMNSTTNGSVKGKLSQNSQNLTIWSGVSPNNRAVSCPPPPVLSTSPSDHKGKIPCLHRDEPFKELCNQLRLLLDKMVPLNFDSTASRIRKLLTTDHQDSLNTDQFCEAVRLIVELAISYANNADIFNMYINLFRSLSKAEFISDEDSKPMNFLNTVVNSCFSLLHIRNSLHEKEKLEKEDEKEPHSIHSSSESVSRMIGSIRIIAALFKAKEISRGQIVDCINRLIRIESENSIHCIHELLRLMGREFDDMVKIHKEKQTWWANLFETMKFIEKRSFATPKVRAFIQEILEARDNNWIFPEANDDEEFRNKVRVILDSLPTNPEISAEEQFYVVSKQLRSLVPTAERRPYLFTDMIDALLAKCRLYHNEVLGVGKTVVDTEKLARMRIENELISTQKLQYADAIKVKDQIILSLEDKNRYLEQEIAKLTKEVLTKEQTIERHLLSENSYRTNLSSNLQQNSDPDEFRQQLAIQLQAYIGNQ